MSAWDSEDFEDTVASALIACFESKVKKDRNIPASMRVAELDLRRMRRLGPYIPANDRVICTAIEGKIAFDLTNDTLPPVGCCAIRLHESAMQQPDKYRGYLFVLTINAEHGLPRQWRRTGPGTLYSLTILCPDQDAVRGDRRFFSVDREGVLHGCYSDEPIYRPGEPDGYLGETIAWGLSALQWIADRRFCWIIQAEESNARVNVGCAPEEIKSLLYARSLPMTATGRKRPILHLVEAHKRRKKNGIDVDVTPFLRGEQTVEIGGTIFRVKPAQVLRNRLSERSVERFLEEAA